MGAELRYLRVEGGRLAVEEDHGVVLIKFSFQGDLNSSKEVIKMRIKES